MFKQSSKTMRFILAGITLFLTNVVSADEEKKENTEKIESNQLIQKELLSALATLKKQVQIAPESPVSEVTAQKDIVDKYKEFFGENVKGLTVKDFTLTPIN